ncbi:MAG: hypothetical protein RL621_1889 [Bacteroidota bacterium]|jgi:hypothetical protein
MKDYLPLLVILGLILLLPKSVSKEKKDTEGSK